MVSSSVMRDIPVAVVVCIDNPLMSVKMRSPSVVINVPLPAAVVGVVVKITNCPSATVTWLPRSRNIRDRAGGLAGGDAGV
jgi:hypothetical protein